MRNKAAAFLSRPGVAPFLFLSPLIALIGCLILIPVTGAVVNSLFRDVTFLPQKFVFFGNYISLFSDSGFTRAAVFTLFFTIVSVFTEMGLGILLALLLNEKLPGRGFLRVAVLIPWAIPVAVSGRVWELIYNFNYGFANSFLLKTGLMNSPVNWLGTEAGAFLALVLADAWKTAPFVAIIVLAGLQTIPDELYEQASIDGAGIFQKFVYITLPVISPVIIVALLFRTIDALRVFDIIFVLTGGGPGGSTASLSMFAYERFLSGDFGGGSAVSVILFLMAMSLSLIYLKAAKLSEALK
ncbi:MAG TPA: sugar ABC transporter permease [bacterium]|nr:sugar ABC transporter permease [bacterium]